MVEGRDHRSKPGFLCQQGQLVLASGSPRRRELLAELGLDFTVVKPMVDEHRLVGEKPEVYVKRLATAKAAQIALRYPDCWVLAADTTVLRADGKLLEKPVTELRAENMLASLSGKWHTVLTGYAFYHRQCQVEFYRMDQARVRMEEIDVELIAAYVATGEPLDKAGGYAVQGIGGVFIQAIEGSPTTVIGLPMHLVLADLLTLEIVRPNKVV